MAYVITRTCDGVCDTACVDVCPCDCIAGPTPVDEIRNIPKDERGSRLVGVQLYIDPAVCIDCNACMAECPVSAIYPDDDVPEHLADDIAANARFFGRH
jgi:NAD-dependent dihydropyrimidine dehydrogenase PreA subunit